ncbi:MAG: J domain-containing protein [Ilumatobacter sp.]|nr:J domain-containing protein [Ilumatobacter sp.]
MSSGHDSFSGPTIGSIPTHYDTLGVRPDASTAEIRAAYLARARVHHPDVATGTQRDVSTSMAELNRAYEVLRRPASRAQYDRELRSPTPAPSAAPRSAPPDGGYDDQVVDTLHDDDGEPIPPSPGARAMRRVLSPSGPAKMPWKLMAVAAVVGSVAIVASAALVDAPQDEPPDGILRVGSCVAVETNTDVREIACSAEAELVVRLVIPTDATCPAAYLPYRDRLGLGTACVEPYEHPET